MTIPLTCLGRSGGRDVMGWSKEQLFRNQRADAEKSIDPVKAGAAYGLSPATALTLWQQVRAEGAPHSVQRFHDAAKRLVAQRWQWRIGRQTLVEEECASESLANEPAKPDLQPASTPQPTPEPAWHAAQAGVSGLGAPLPYLERLQRLFGPKHDLSRIQAHVGPEATAATHALGAAAYATGHQIAFRATPSLHLAAHEVAHVVQQAAGIQLASGLGSEGDEHERQADAVADRVVQGRSAHDLLPQIATRPSYRAELRAPVQLSPSDQKDVPAPPRFAPEVKAALPKQGTSPNAGTFDGLRGATIEDVISRVPAGWTAKPTKGIPGAHFSDPKNPGNAIRIHAADPKAPTGSNSASGWTLRITKNGNYYDEHGNNLTVTLGGKNGKQAEAGHIPMSENPRVTAQAPKPNVAPPLPSKPPPNETPPAAQPPSKPPLAEEAPPPKIHPPETPKPPSPGTKSVGENEGVSTAASRKGGSAIAEVAAEESTLVTRTLRGFRDGIKTFFSAKVQVPLAIAFELVTFLDAMDMAKGTLSGEGFLLRNEIKKSLKLQQEASLFRNWYDGYHDDLLSGVSNATIAIVTLGSRQTREQMKQYAPEVIAVLRSKLGEVRPLLAKATKIRDEADQKAKFAENLLQSQDFASITAISGTAIQATVFAAMEDLIKIRGYTATCVDDLQATVDRINEDIDMLAFFLH